jgi:hypothetical protein
MKNIEKAETPKSEISILPPRPFRASGKVAQTAFRPARREGKICIPTLNQTFADSRIPQISKFHTFRIAVPIGGHRKYNGLIVVLDQAFGDFRVFSKGWGRLTEIKCFPSAAQMPKAGAICRQNMIDKPCRNGALCENLSDEVFRVCLSAMCAFSLRLDKALSPTCGAAPRACHRARPTL